MTPPEPVSTLLRASVLVTAVCGLAALALTGLLSAAAAAVAAVLLGAAAAAPVLFSSPAGRSGRRATAAGATAASAAMALLLGSTRGAFDVATAPSELGRLIVPLMIGVLIAQLLGSDRPRDLVVALALSAMIFVLGIGMTPRPAVAAPLLVAWPAVVTALHEIQASRQFGRADVVAVADRGEAPVRRVPGPVALLAVVSTVVAVLAVLAIPSSDGISRRSSFGTQGAEGFAGVAGRSARAYSSGVLDLRSRGELPDTPVAEVPADSPQLWRGVVLSDYDGTTWRATGRPALEGPPSDEAVRRDRVQIRAGFSGVLLSPGRPLAIDVSGGVLPLAGGFVIRAPAVGGYPTSYTVSTDGTEPSDESLREATGPDPAGATDVALPARVPARVRELSRRLTAGSGSRYDAVLAVERHLRTNATYRLDSPVPPPGHDAVDHFLFEARAGFCEQFASAEAVLLRAAGIPSRLATGFAGGDKTDDDRLMRAADAHAWVEVWYPGIGWVASDPTAGAQLADGSRSLTARLDGWLRAIRERLGLTLALGASALVVLVGAVVSLVRRRARRGAARQSAVHRPKSPVVAAFARLEAALERAGRPRAAAESLSELAQRLPEEQRVTDALTVLEQVCYGPLAPEVRAVHDAAAVIDDLAARVLAEQPR